jgi:tetratricopeptide (TPR) repeat protein
MHNKNLNTSIVCLEKSASRRDFALSFVLSRFSNQIPILSKPGNASLLPQISLRNLGKNSGILLLTLFFLFCGCHREDPEVKFQHLMQQAKDYSKQEKWDEARINLMSASELKPKEADVYYELAEVLMHQQNYARAVENYRAAINYKPDHKEARMHLAALMLAGKDFEAAEDQIKKLAEISPDDPDVMLLQANLAANSPKRDLDTADKIFRKILEKHPDNTGALAGLGEIAVVQKKLKEAEDYFLKAMKTDPKNGPLQMVLADLYSRQGRLDEAQEIVEQLLKDNPKNIGLRYGFGEFLLRRGLSDQATEQYEEILKSDPLRHDARDRLYDMYLVRKNYDKATALTAALEKSNADNPGTQYFKGRDLELQGKNDQALELYLKAIPGMSNFAPVFRRAGLFEIAKGDSTTGLQHLNQAIAIDPGDVGARLALARNALADHNYAIATEHVNQVLQRYPRQLGANVLRADIALIQGDTDTARKVYQYLIDTFPNSPTGYFKLGLLEEKSGNTDKAIELYRKTLTYDTGVLLPAQRLTALLVKKEGLPKTTEEIKDLLEKSKNSKPEYKLIIGTLTLADKSDPEHFEHARKYFSEAVDERPTLSGAYFALAAIDAQKGDLDAAAANYEKLIKQNNKHIPSYMLLALARERQGRFADAAKVYRDVLEIEPRFGPAANNLAWLLAEKLNGDLDEALRLAQTAKEVLPNEGSVADTLGWVHYKRGSKQVAETFLSEAVELEKKAGDKRVNPEILYHLAQVQQSLGETDKAKQSIAEAIQGAGEQHPMAKEFAEFQKKLG